jgi:hypothetical protein
VKRTVCGLAGSTDPSSRRRPKLRSRRRRRISRRGAALHQHHQHHHNRRHHHRRRWKAGADLGQVADCRRAPFVEGLASERQGRRPWPPPPPALHTRRIVWIGLMRPPVWAISKPRAVSICPTAEALASSRHASSHVKKLLGSRRTMASSYCEPAQESRRPDRRHRHPAPPGDRALGYCLRRPDSPTSHDTEEKTRIISSVSISGGGISWLSRSPAPRRQPS